MLSKAFLPLLAFCCLHLSGLSHAQQFIASHASRQRALLPCLLTPCLNGGTCTGLLNSFQQCACTLGYHGNQCQSAVVPASPPAGCLAPTSAIRSFTSTTGGTNGGQTVGYEVILQDAVTVIYLGTYDAGFDGLTVPHQVALWRKDGTMLASITVPGGAATPFISGFRVAKLASPILLAAGTYRLGVKSPNTNDYYFVAATALTLSPRLSWSSNYRNAATDTIRFPNTVDSLGLLGGENLANMGPTMIMDDFSYENTCLCTSGNAANCFSSAVCTSNPCANGGTCSVTALDAYTCTCTAGFTGINCQTTLSKCLSSPCSNGGSCIDTVGNTGFTCACSALYTGMLCQSIASKCLSSPCSNGGSCVDGANNGLFTCTCSSAYTGVLCQSLTSKCRSSPCSNGGICVEGVSNVDFSCTCRPGFTGILCEADVDECASSPCSSGSSCHQNSPSFGFACACAAGFTGTLCQSDMDECTSSPCANGGLCLQNAPSFGFVCVCPMGFSGVLCQSDLNECVSSPCSHGGTCSQSNAPNLFRCTCTSGFTGASCEYQMSSLCLSNPCQNGGACIDGPGLVNYTCSCASGFTGESCSVVLDPCLSVPCQNGAMCTSGVGNLDFICSCGTLFTGTLCQSAISKCVSSPCSNGGVCVDGLDNGLFMCTCAPGFTGILCQSDVDECASSPCSNGGTCGQVNSANLYSCTCTAGYTGRSCQTALSKCLSSPCANNGICTDTSLNAGYVCTCPFGYTGLGCLLLMDPCLSSPCQQGGVCQTGALNAYFTCSCPSNYTGLTCQNAVSKCLSNPCQNLGHCIDGLDNADYSCQCPIGFTGMQCQSRLSQCLSQPCTNGGLCLDVLNNLGFTCQCPLLYTGSLCEVFENPCNSSPCLYGGTCNNVEPLSIYTCTCVVERGGALCETLLSDAEVIDQLSNYAPSGNNVNQRALTALSLMTIDAAASLPPLAKALANVTSPSIAQLEPSDVTNALISLKNLIDSAQNATIDIITSAELSLVETFSNLLTQNGTASSSVNISQTIAGGYLLERLPLAILDSVTTCSFSINLTSVDRTVYISGWKGTLAELQRSNMQFNHHSVQFSGQLQAGWSNTTCLSFYMNLLQSDVFFQTQSPGDAPLGRRRRDSNSWSVVSDVLSVGFGGSPSTGLQLESNITLTFPIDPSSYPAGGVGLACVAWDFSNHVWYRDGCTLLPALNASDSLRCSCNHMTNFAVMFDPNFNPDEESAKPLAIISYIGLITNIIGAACVLVCYFLLPKLQTLPIRLVMILCMGIIASQLMFMVNVIMAPSASAGSCFALGFLLHYFMLVQFASLAVLGIAYYRLLGKREQLRSNFLPRSVVALLIAPMILLAVYWIVYATTAEGPFVDIYNNTRGVCFMSTSAAFWVTFLVPMLIVLAWNVFVYFAIVCTIQKLEKHMPSSAQRTKTSVFLSLALMLGLTWLFCILIVASSEIVFKYLAAIANGVLGLYLLINFVLNRKVRQSIVEWSTRIRTMTISSTRITRKTESSIPRHAVVVVADRKTNPRWIELQNEQSPMSSISSRDTSLQLTGTAVKYQEDSFQDLQYIDDEANTTPTSNRLLEMSRHINTRSTVSVDTILSMLPEQQQHQQVWISDAPESETCVCIDDNAQPLTPSLEHFESLDFARFHTNHAVVSSQA